MSMEHRWDTRKATAVEAVVRYPALGLVRGKVRNIGLGGMYVETGAITFNVNTPVDVTVRIGKHSADGLFHMHAWVVWTGASGAGLMFRAFDDTSYAALQELVSERQTLLQRECA